MSETAQEQTYRSVHARLLESEFYLCALLKNEDALADALATKALDIARGRYTNMAVIPIGVAFEGEEWIPVDVSHTIYVKDSEAYARDLKSREIVKMFGSDMVECQSNQTGDLQFKHLMPARDYRKIGP